MAKKVQYGFKEMKKLLAECAFNPRIPNHPLSIILNVHGDNPHFLEGRAIEMIMEAQLSRDQSNPGPGSKAWTEQYHEKMTKAIALLTIARMATIKKMKAE